jgi:hypothetical protein
VWIPLAQLHLAEGAWDLVAALSVVSDGRVLASGTTPVFRAGQGAPPATLAPAAEVHEVWFTYGDVVDSVIGMTVHSRITVQGLRGQAVQFVSWFWKGDATPLFDFDNNFRTGDGQVSASVTLTPLYEVAIFTDCAIFIPYPQLHLAPGVHPLGVTLGVFSGGIQIGSKVEMTQFQLTQQ